MKTLVKELSPKERRGVGAMVMEWEVLSTTTTLIFMEDRSSLPRLYSGIDWFTTPLPLSSIQFASSVEIPLLHS